MIAKDERAAAAAGQGCLGKAADDEPVFVLRAKDRFAPILVEIWASMVVASSGPSPKTEDAFSLVEAMKDWQDANGCKTPD